MALGHVLFILLAILFIACVFGLLWWGFSRIWPLIPLPEPIKTILYVLLVVIVGLILLYAAYDIFTGASGCLGLRC
jgi:hypothetical protein